MGIAPDFILLGAIGTTLLLDRAIAVRRPRWAVARKGIHLVSPASVLRIVPRHRVKWIAAAELSRLIREEADMVMFRLIDDPLLEDGQSDPTSAVAVTLEQLANAIPWVPSGSRVVIYRTEGIDTSYASEVAKVLRGREALFFAGNAQSLVEA